MKIAAIIQAHNDDDVVLDTIDSVKRWMTTDILTVVDGVSWDGLDKSKFSSSYVVEGLNHGVSTNPYRNVFFGLKQAYDQWPDKDWYCYLEYDCLVTSNFFESDLKKAEQLNYWVLGADLRLKKCKFPFVENIINKKFNETFHILGCFYFLHRDYIAALNDLDFFDKFLSLTNYFYDGFFPMSSIEFDTAEELVPTLAYYLGGKVGCLSVWGDGLTHPHNSVVADNGRRPEHHLGCKLIGESSDFFWGGLGNFRKYPIRWRPELNENENFIETTIMHPLKNYNNPIRQYHRCQRNSKVVTLDSEHVDIKIYPSLLDVDWCHRNGIVNFNIKDEMGTLWSISGDEKGVNSVLRSGPFDFSF